MRKRIISIIISLCLIFTMFLVVQVNAAGNIALAKTVYTVDEMGHATISGLTTEEIEYGAFLAIEVKDTKPANATQMISVSDLPVNYIWDFMAPSDLGVYDVMLLDGNGNLISKVTITIGAPKALEGDISLSKNEVKLGEPMSVTIKGLTDGQLFNDAWFGKAAFIVSGTGQ